MAANNTKSPWKTLSQKVIFKNPWLALRQDDVVMPNGKQGTYTLLEAKPFVIIVAIAGDDFVLIEQYRYPVKRKVIEFPAGGIQENENLLDAAKRELREETGYTADSWNYVGPFFELVSISYQPGHLFIATQLHKEQRPTDEEGITKYIRMDKKEVQDHIISGNVIDALTPAVFMKALLWLEHNKISRS